MELASNGYLDMELLRFTTAGSVDDGKSTLIGRLLYDSKSIFEDQMEAVRQASMVRGHEEVNLALLTDGLRAEREQGITIDVAYRYFATPRRKFIIADTPGHIQYTRNMVTGASTAHAALILVDARQGVLEQTLRHAYIASLLRIPHVVFCINKMDLAGFGQNVFSDITAQLRAFELKLGLQFVHFVPVSAKWGDNVVDRSERMPWYEGPTLLELLEEIPVGAGIGPGARFPVQYVVRPNSDAFHDYRGYAGRVAGGCFAVGDKVQVLPSGQESVIASIDLYRESLTETSGAQSVTIRLRDDVDVSRGDMLVKNDPLPVTGQDIVAMICWMNPRALRQGNKYILRHTSAEVRCVVRTLESRVQISTLEEVVPCDALEMNGLGRIRLRTTRPLVFDAYRDNRNTGSFVLIDEGTFETVGAGMIVC